ncbi:hypothetical protein NL43_07435 [Methanosphaera sp. WGK6]|nr:hypothetical protein NL43_07435 [Methanosphaera sp. WGK6]
MDRKFEIDDIIEIDGQIGQVKKIGFRSVELFKNNKFIVVPNKLFTTKSFVNYTQRGFYKVKFTIKLPNDDTLNEKLDVLDEIIKNNNYVLDNPGHSIFITGMSAFGMEILVKFFLINPLDDNIAVSEILNEFRNRFDFKYDF